MRCLKMREPIAQAVDGLRCHACLVELHKREDLVEGELLIKITLGSSA